MQGLSFVDVSTLTTHASKNATELCINRAQPTFDLAGWWVLTWNTCTVDQAPDHLPGRLSLWPSVIPLWVVVSRSGVRLRCMRVQIIFYEMLGGCDGKGTVNGGNPKAPCISAACHFSCWIRIGLFGNVFVMANPTTNFGTPRSNKID